MARERIPGEIEANGGVIGYDIVGSGPPLLCIGGANIEGDPSPPFFREHVGDEYTVICTDLREVGRSKFPPEDYTFADLADDQAAVIRGLGYERVHVAGLSHTGLVAQYLALRHPDLVDHLVLANTSRGGPARTDIDDASRLTVEDYRGMGVTDELAKLLTRREPRTMAEYLSLAMSPRTLERNPTLVAETEAALARDAQGLYGVGRVPDAADRFWKAQARSSTLGQLSAIRARTLVIYGADDGCIDREEIWGLWQEIPGALFVVFDNVGHGYPIESPERGEFLLKAFLRGDL